MKYWKWKFLINEEYKLEVKSIISKTGDFTDDDNNIIILTDEENDINNKITYFETGNEIIDDFIHFWIYLKFFI